MRNLLSIWIGKLIYIFMRSIGRHGAALPGLIVEKFNSDLLHLLRDLPDGVIIVTGTNGKTSTTHFIAHGLRQGGKKVFTNHSGSNMTRGILASIIRFSGWRGRLDYDIAVLEIDEAYAALLAPILQPKYSVLTNVLRDQLDRFGEIDKTAGYLKAVAENTTDNSVINGYDPRLVEITDGIKNRLFFGYSNSLSEHFPSDEEIHGTKRHNANVKTYAKLINFSEGIVYLQSGNMKYEMNTRLIGWHNAMNLTAAWIVLKKVFNMDPSALFQHVEAPYGRGEVLIVDGKQVMLQLVKNPAGFNTALQVMPNWPALIVVNDAYADSRDVSWLWDFRAAELLHRPSIYCSGTRAFDIALRLKYENIKVVETTTDLSNAIKIFLTENEGGVVFLTYTAMLQTRRLLIKKFGAIREADQV